VKACFGPGVLTPDGHLDRARMAAQVFSNRDQLEKLNRVLHPLIAAQIRFRIEDLRRAGFDGVVIVDVPLLFECGWQKIFDCTIVVYCEPNVQRNRLMERSDLDAAQADARIASQMPLCEKKNRADFIVDNQGTVQALRPAVADLYARLLSVG
jgi:dephospho-CoA kinase